MYLSFTTAFLYLDDPNALQKGQGGTDKAETLGKEQARKLQGIKPETAGGSSGGSGLGDGIGKDGIMEDVKEGKGKGDLGKDGLGENKLLGDGLGKDSLGKDGLSGDGSVKDRSGKDGLSDLGAGKDGLSSDRSGKDGFEVTGLQENGKSGDGVDGDGTGEAKHNKYGQLVPDIKKGMC